jgi:hypothetical protein
MNSSNTNQEKNEMLCMKIKIRVLHKAYKHIFEQLYSSLSHPVLRLKPDAHRMYAQDQVVIHTARM